MISKRLVDFKFTGLLGSDNWIFILALIVFGLALFLMLGKILLAQLLLLFVFFAVDERSANPIFWLTLVLQMALSIWTVARIVLEIEWSYSRRLEKTLKLPRSITKAGNAGIRDFWF